MVQAASNQGVFVHGESERRPFVHRAPHKPSHTDADGTNDRALTAVDTRDENVMAKFSGSVPCVNCQQAAPATRPQFLKAHGGPAGRWLAPMRTGSTPR